MRVIRPTEKAREWLRRTHPDVPPMVQDAYAILKEGLENERKIRCNKEQEEERLKLSNGHNR